MRRRTTLLSVSLVLTVLTLAERPAPAQAQEKPVLHAQEWIAITGKPRGAAAGAMMFEQGGNAVDAAAAMLGVVSTMWDVLSWGGETQAIIHNPETGEVIGVNGLGWAPSEATVEYYKERDHDFPPGSGPLAATTPGTPGALMAMVAEFGELSLAQVLAPSIRMADGYPIESGTAGSIARSSGQLSEWEYSRHVFLDEDGDTPAEGEIFRQPDLAETLRKLVEAEEEALAAGASREEAIQSAHERFYEGDIAEEFVRGAREEGGIISMEDLAEWEVRFEETRATTYNGIEVHKLKEWTQGPMMLQALNILENADLEEMGYNSTRYIHTLYQAMNLAFADRDFYYGDPRFDPETPIEGLLSKEYAAARFQEMDPEANDPEAAPGDPYPYQGEENPFTEYLELWEPNPDPEAVAEELDGTDAGAPEASKPEDSGAEASQEMGTTSIQAADADGWVVSVTPSGGWIPAVVAGETGIGMSQRMQSFVLDEFRNPYNVLEPRKQPRVTLTPSLALKDGEPYLSFAVQGGDYQDQYLLQLFLNVVHHGMNIQEAVEAPNIRSHQMRGSFGSHEANPGRLHLNEEVPSWVRRELRDMGYNLTFGSRTSGPLNAIHFDQEKGTMWGGASNFGDDYGIGW